jgi:5-formyltetrahydrofolate cyclo-ligase
MRALRLVVDQKEGPLASMRLTQVFLSRLTDVAIQPGSVIAGYWPIATEIDVRPLLARLAERGFATALPVVAAGEVPSPLTFRQWHPVDALEEGPHGTMHPLPLAADVLPDVLFVPLLAVDTRGHRLGQGLGFYDRTLASLRRRHSIIAIGVGFALQFVEGLPYTVEDQRMDWILTEHELIRAVL